MKQPTLEEFLGYAAIKITAKNDDPRTYQDWLKDKYEAWDLAGWKKEKGGKLVEILIWKTTLLQCLAFRQPNKVKDTAVRAELVRPGEMNRIDRELVLGAWNTATVMKTLPLKWAGAFNVLATIGLIKTGKGYEGYYDKVKMIAGGFIVARLIDEQKTLDKDDRAGRRAIDRRMDKVKRYEDAEIELKAKCLVLQDFFKKYEFEEQLSKLL